jgi:hypothetical protein
LEVVISLDEEDRSPEQNEEEDSRSQCEAMTDDGSRCSLQKVGGKKVCHVHLVIWKDANALEGDIQNRIPIITLLTFAFAVIFMGDIFPLLGDSHLGWERSNERITNAEAVYCCFYVPVFSIFAGISSLYGQRKILTGKWNRPPGVYDSEHFWEELERDPTIVVDTDSRGRRSYGYGGACERCQRERPEYKTGEMSPHRFYYTWKKESFSFCYDCKKIICGSCKVVNLNLGMPPEIASRVSAYGKGRMTTSGGICKDCYSERNPSGDNDPW